jgi:nitrite reductase (cytochrome c-552)
VEKGQEVVNPIGCQDCHDPQSMKLRITRPALIEAFKRQGKDIKKSSHQEMRSLVCAQCHVEYYFRKSDNYLFFPWDSGMTVETMEKYYDNMEYYDWKHALSRTPMLKAQHPDYEIYKMSVHAKRGVSCADCHMPYKTEGGAKYSDHHLQSPLANISQSCQVCHKESEKSLYEDVVERQNKALELRRIAEKTLARVHIEAKSAWDAGATEQEMKPILQLIRQAQWRWDWMSASNSLGFHSPVEAMRVIGNSVSRAKEAHGLLEVLLTKKGVQTPIALPDISTKAKAQKYIGLDMDALRKDKEAFLKKVVLQWDEKAKQRQGGYLNKY